ncbi:hypothetical protein CHS0354_030148, partial [Potamilus streckersoni]
MLSTTTSTKTISFQNILKDVKAQTDNITSEATAETEILTQIYQNSEEKQSTDDEMEEVEVR